MKQAPVLDKYDKCGACRGHWLNSTVRIKTVHRGAKQVAVF